jgi:hypothetical protein
MDTVYIKSDFGEIAVEFSTLEELSKKLGDIEHIAEIVRTKASSILSSTHALRQAKPGFEDIYRFLPDGTVELLVHPTKNVQKVALVLFAYDRAIPVSLIEKCTSIRNVAHDVLQSGANRKYFARSSEGHYALSPSGTQWVTSTVIPRLRKNK